MFVRRAVVVSLAVVGLLAPLAGAGPAEAGVPSASRAHTYSVPRTALQASTRPRAALTAAGVALASGKVRVSATSNAKKVKVAYRTSKNKKRTTTITIRGGKGSKTLARGSKSIKAQAKATTKLRASLWTAVTGFEPTAGPGRTYSVTPSSRILGSMAKYSTVNQYTRHYYLIRSYMHLFESAGGGTLILGPGRYEISSTIFVPSNVTLRLSAGTTLVKSNTTGTTKFSASSSMFMLIRPSMGQTAGAVGGYDGDHGITIAGAGAGQSVIDMANLYNTLGIISGHNRGVTISGIRFTRMNNNHYIEMDACADCVISGNEFLDAAGGTRETAEAINLDTPDPKTGGFGSVWSKQDSTPNLRVTVAGNRFDGMKRAVGTHNFSAGRYHTDIVVRDNTITSNADDAIHFINWTNPVITGNAISSRSGAVGIRVCGTSNPTITGNTFSESGTAVVFRSCSGENGTARANTVTLDNVAALRANAVGPGLGSAAVNVPDFGTTWFNGHEPPPEVPSSPYVNPVVAGDGQATVTWSAANADPRAPVTGYRVRVHPSTTDGPILTLDLAAEPTQTVITGLTNGTTYYISVAALSNVGEGASSWLASGRVTPVGLPSTPTQVVGTSNASRTATISWSAPTSTGGQALIGYRVYGYSDPAATQLLPGSPMSTSQPGTITWSGLTGGMTYHFRVTALNPTGEGPASPIVAVQVKP